MISFRYTVIFKGLAIFLPDNYPCKQSNFHINCLIQNIVHATSMPRL